jgi:hypothetical protein
MTEKILCSTDEGTKISKDPYLRGYPAGIHLCSSLSDTINTNRRTGE